MMTKKKFQHFPLIMWLLLTVFFPCVCQAQTTATYRTKNNQTDIVKKYSLLLSADEKDIERFKALYNFVDQWLNVRYLWGGCTMAGVDCSCFVKNLFDEVYKIKIERTSFTQFYDNDVSLFKNMNNYSTGDLVFFKTNISRETRNNRITHVGIYLTNGYFVQSSSKGVNIANLNDGYWKNCMVAAGRLKESFYIKARMKVSDADIDENKAKFVVEENSYFAPPMISERYDSLIKKYALLLEVPAESLRIPEIFAFIDSTQKHPYIKDCNENAGASDCMISDLYKAVFDVDINAGDLALQKKEIFQTWKKDDRLSEGDVVYFKTSPKKNYYDNTGLYLHNGHIVFIENDTLVVKPLLNIKAKKIIARFARFNKELLEAAGNNLIAARKREDSLSRFAAVVPIKQEPVATKLQSEDFEMAFSLGQKKLHEMVQAVEVPYQETQDQEYLPIVKRYAKELNIHPLYLNPLLISFTNNWRNKNYKKGACSDKRIGSECFVTKYFAEVLDRKISIKNLSQLNGSYLKQLDDKAILKTGDILFFGKRYEASYDLNFVGIYLGGKSFLALSPFKEKVTIASVIDKQYEDLFLAAGRPL